MRSSLASASLALLAVGACQNHVVATSHGSGGGGAGGASSSSSGGPSGTLVAACPASPPPYGTPCSDMGLLCEYGNDLDWNCNIVAHCNPSQQWEQGSFGGGACPSPALGIGGGCAASRAVASQGGTCATDNEVCAYPEGICVCTPPATIGPGMPPTADASTPPSTWQCATPSPGCPPFRPRIGSACTTPDLHCDYGICGVPDGSSYGCDPAGYWTDSYSGPCGGA